MNIPHTINTSNPAKQREFERFFARYNFDIQFTSIEVDEIVAAPAIVTAHKALTVGPEIIVEDTNLDVEGFDFGITIKQKINQLADTNVVGSSATCHVYMGFMRGDEVFVFHASVAGKIVKPRGLGKGFGFDPYFEPVGSCKTLAEEKLDQFNARWLCIERMMQGQIDVIIHIKDLLGNFVKQ